MAIVLTLDEQTARDLRDSLIAVGEHIAAGAPIAPTDRETSLRLRVVIDQLDTALRDADASSN
jgi:hypothetical protein